MANTAVKASGEFLDVRAERDDAGAQHHEQRRIGREQRATAAEPGIGLGERAPTRSPHRYRPMWSPPSPKIGSGDAEKRRGEHQQADDDRKPVLVQSRLQRDRFVTLTAISDIPLPRPLQTASKFAVAITGRKTASIRRQYDGEITARQSHRILLLVLCRQRRSRNCGRRLEGMTSSISARLHGRTAYRPAPLPMASANERSTMSAALSFCLIKPARKYRSMVFCSSATTPSSIGATGSLPGSAS